MLYWNKKYGSYLDQDRLSHDKESITINLKQKQGIEIVKKLTNNADVLIEPFRKGYYYIFIY